MPRASTSSFSIDRAIEQLQFYQSRNMAQTNSSPRQVPDQPIDTATLRRSMDRISQAMDRGLYGHYNDWGNIPIGYNYDTDTYSYAKKPAQTSIASITDFIAGDIIYWTPDNVWNNLNYVIQPDGRRYGIVTRTERDLVWAYWGCDKDGNGGDKTERYIAKNKVTLYTAQPIFNIPKEKDYTDMAFGARKEEKSFVKNGKTYKQTWRLCLRKGRIIEGSAFPSGEDKDWVDFAFTSQKQAKACADELNEKFWTAYKDNGETMDGMTHAVAEEMVNTIKGYL